jgi:RsiW-degrading membrane proteinase PrsW (M82 family)
MMETAQVSEAGGGLELDFAGMMALILQRSLMAPFAHGLWSGILAAGFWAAGRSWGRAVRSREFWASAGLSIGLHGLWNCCDLFGEAAGWLALLASGVLSFYVYRQLLRAKGYLSLDAGFWRR